MPPRTITFFAAVSHLPHLLAFALVDELAARPDADELFRFAASGFRDFTRIAASSPECGAIVRSPTGKHCRQKSPRFEPSSIALRVMLAASARPRLEAMFTAARTARRAWDSRRNAAAGRVPDDGPREP
jgi:prephenate dehydrogenase